MATTTIDKEIEFSRLLDELSKLIFERDAALSSLAEVDQHLTALSTAIGITSSGLNTPAGLLCMLCPVTHLADVLGNGSTSSTNHLFEVTLRNDSTLPLLGNWNILLARLKPQESSVVHVAALPQIAAGAAWTGTVALDLSSSLTQDTVDLAVFLCFNGDSNTSISTVDTSSHRSASHIALLHIFRIDSLHSLQASSGGGSGSSSGLRNYYFSSGSQMMEIKLGVPKQFFGLDPDPQNVLNVLLKQGERSLCLPLTKQILNEKGSNNNDNNNSDISTTTTLVNGGIVQRRQHKAVVQGQLPQNHFTATDQNKSAAASVGSAASLSIQPAPFSLASSSSPHALLDLTCEAGNTVNCLKLHKAALRRVQQLQTAVRENSRGGGAESGGIELSHGVLVPSACSFGAILDSNELEETYSKLSSLREAAVRLRETILAGEGVSEEKIAAELLELVKDTRNQTKNLVITL